eukprot:m.72893 g.72893  ORF g.72893 m.72893 type:complete len:352 (+) comp8806_c0_seq2:73-1128(+)
MPQAQHDIVWTHDSTPEAGAVYRNARPLFLPFARAVSREIEAAYSADQDVCVVRAGGQGYRIDFARMQRLNLRSGDVCDVRRSNLTTGLPSAKRACHTNVQIPAEHYFRGGQAIDWQAVTAWRRIHPPAYDPSEKDLMDEELGPGDDSEPVVELSCSTPTMRCVYRQSFIEKALDSNPTCCSCGFKFPTPGPQPEGRMKVTRISDSCAGFEHTGSIMIDYSFPSGRQHDRMPNPGESYSGTRRIAYLPDTPAIGERALALLERAFLMGQIFRVGTSVTTGVTNTTVWGGIHHKTRPSGGVERHGWPDPTYMDRLVSECAACGIMEPHVAGDPAAEADAIREEEPPPSWTPP